MKISTKKGYTLLFAVIVSVLVLSIAAFILSVSRKQAILASSARDSIYAFYAADSGLECAVENLAQLAVKVPGSTITCGNSVNIPVISSGNTDTAGAASFSMLTGNGSSFTGSSNQSSQSGAASCASTLVSYVTTNATYDPTTGDVKDATSTVVTVVTRGYNIGWKPGVGAVPGDCSVPGSRKVERALQYTQYQ